MKKDFKCPICSKTLYSGVGKGCLMCGMLLEKKFDKFCCKICMRKYNTISKVSERRKYF